MGTSTSVHKTSSRRINVRQNPVFKQIKCPKHWDHSATHYHERNNELLCFVCFQDFKRRNPRNESDVKEISKYVGTISFKQTETSLSTKLQKSRRTAEHQLLEITQNKKAIENKKAQFVEEIKSFVKSLVELIQHLGDDLCSETENKVMDALNELDILHKDVQKQLEKMETLSKDFDTYRQSDNNAGRVDTLMKCKGYFKKSTLVDNKRGMKKFEPSLRLHKSLTLSEIVGRGGPNNRVTLGTVSCNERTERDHDTLSDISENSDETDPEFDVHNRAGRNTISRNVSGRTSSISPTKKIGKTAMLIHGDNNHYPSTSGSPKYSNSNNDELTSNDSTESGYINVGRFSAATSSQNHHLIGEHNGTLSRNRSMQSLRRVEDPSRTGRVSAQQTPTPRRSSQSIVSPGNISANLFQTPRQGTNRDSMERRIAVKLKDVKLPSDEFIHNITDTTVLEDGRIVMCDQKNEKLILLNENQEFAHDIKVSGHPHNLTKVPGDGCRVAVTIPDENIVKIIGVTTETFSDEIEIIKLQTKPICLGIDYINDNMLYTTRNDVACIRKDMPKQTWKFKYAFQKPISLHADRKNGTFFVSCYGINSSGEVVKMKYADESIEFVFSCPEIKRPVCTTVDIEGYLYICDVDPPSIHQVSSKGEYCRRLLSANEGKFQHINFIPGTDIFIATENDSNKVHFYRME